MAAILITGGHAGIGLACSRQLASGSHLDLILAGRSPDQMEAAARELRATYGVKVSTLALDTSSLASVRSAAAQCRAMLDRGDVGPLRAILCNAGAQFNGPVSYSADGYEQTFATNCLGHFLLIQLLLDCVEQGGRIVFTASGTHDPDTPDGKMVGKVVEPDARALANDGKNGAKPLSPGVRYTTSKLCTVLYAYELARLLRRMGSSVASIAFDPGSIPETGLLRTMPRPVQLLARTSLMKWVMKRMGITQSTVAFSGGSLARVAVDPAFQSGSGKYFQCSYGRLSEQRSSVLSYDEVRAVKLWGDSEALVHLLPAERPHLLMPGDTL